MEVTERFRFPDGQPHVVVRSDGGRAEEIVARITDSESLIDVLLQADALRRQGVETINLTIPYLMGARMDRAMPDDERGSHPFTLQVVADVLGTGDFEDIRVFDPHSSVTVEHLRRSACHGTVEVLRPHRQVRAALALLGSGVYIASPDEGAVARTDDIARRAGYFDRETFIVRALKKRDSSTGALTGFRLDGTYDLGGRDVLIVDDICDGGRTFSGVAEVLRSAGAGKVHLYVSHGIFSKGFDIEGIDRIFTTDSYRDWGGTEGKGAHMTALPWR